MALTDAPARTDSTKILTTFVKVVIRHVILVQMVFPVQLVYLHKTKLLALLAFVSVQTQQFITHPYRLVKPVTISVLPVSHQNLTVPHVLHLPSEPTLITNVNAIYIIMMTDPMLFARHALISATHVTQLVV